jgi:P63C domain-containing protein
LTKYACYLYSASIEIKEVASMSDESIQSKGGMARAEVLSPKERSDIARKAAQTRWASSILNASHFGPLTIGNREFECAVLEDGTRVFTRATFVRAIGRTGKAKGGRAWDREFKVPVFLTAENLKSFISKDLEENSKTIQFRYKNSLYLGYSIDLLRLVCEVFIDAKESGGLRKNQTQIAEACRILYRGFAKVGLVALVDEATGYQEVRDKLALQAILDEFLLKEFAAWAKRFPDEFYQHIFRLRGWAWKGMKVNRPQVVANYTKDLVYARLAPGILKELEVRNPIESGRRKAKHHQWLTEDIGHPALAQHLYAVIGLMRISETWDQFKKILERAYPKRGDTLQLPLFKDASVPAIVPLQPSSQSVLAFGEKV